MAVSFSIVLAASGIFNFALESVVTLGAISAYALIVGVGLPSLVAGLVILVGGALAGTVMYLVVGRVFEQRSSDYTGAIAVATIGLALAIDSGSGLLFGPTSLGVPSFVTSTPIQIGSVTIRPIFLVMFGVLVVVVVAGELVLRLTQAGRIMRANQQDTEGASLLGINTRKVMAWAFVVSGVMAAFAGFLVVPVTYASSSVGMGLLLPSFAAMAMGGFGSFQGAIGGGLLIGVIEGVGPFLVNVDAIDTIIFGLMIAVLVLRPTGIFGARGLRTI
jgi:branched-subunit amino acid ABC-type transport system permease component